MIHRFHPGRRSTLLLYAVSSRDRRRGRERREEEVEAMIVQRVCFGQSIVQKVCFGQSIVQRGSWEGGKGGRSKQQAASPKARNPSTQIHANPRKSGNLKQVFSGGSSYKTIHKISNRSFLGKVNPRKSTPKLGSPASA